MSVCLVKSADVERAGELEWERAAKGAPRRAAGTVALGRARRELGLKPREFELAVQLGELGTVPVARGPGRRRRVPVSELARLRRAEGCGQPLRERLRLVGATEGAALLGVGPARFARLARSGCFSPVRFTVNRYRRLVWLYLAAELRQFGERQSALLHGALPGGLRAVLEQGEDWRPRLWRSRRIAQLVRLTGDAWEAAAVHAAVLDQDTFEAAVPDPAERRVLAQLRPRLAPVRPAALATWEVIEEVLTAEAEDEIRWHRMSLTLALGAARATGPVPGTGEPPAAAAPAAAASGAVRPEQPFLHHGHQQPALPVVDAAAGQPSATGRDG